MYFLFPSGNFLFSKEILALREIYFLTNILLFCSEIRPEQLIVYNFFYSNFYFTILRVLSNIST